MAERPEPAAARQSELSLVYADPQGRPRVFAIPDGTTTLGRARDNDLVLDDPTVTAHHVVLLRDGDRLELRDLFAGDTLVNELRRRNGALAPGDVLSLGQVRLRVMKVVPRRGANTGAFARGQTDRLARIEPRTQRVLRPAPPERPGAPTGSPSPASPSPSPASPSPASPPPASPSPASPSPASPTTASSASAPGRHPTRALAAEPPRPARGATGRTTTAAMLRPEAASWLDEADAPDDPPADRIATAPLARPGAPDAEAPPAAALEELRALQDRDARRERQLARARQVSDEMLLEDDFEVILEHIALGFLDVFAADRAVTVLFEEDGRNPLLTVERRRDGTDDGTGVAQEIVDRCLQVRSVIKIAGGHQGLGGLAAPLLSKGKAVGLLYFERMTASGQALDAADVHLMAMLSNQAAVVIAPLVT